MRRAYFAALAGIFVLAGAVRVGSNFFAGPKERALPPVQLEVGDQMPREIPLHSKPGSQRLLLIATSATCGPCSEDREFEDGLASIAARSGVPVWYLLSSDHAQDGLARDFAGRRLHVSRGSLADLGFSRTPTFAAVDRQGRIIAMRTGSVPSQLRETVTAELLHGTSKPLYSRIDMRGVQSIAASAVPYGMIELAPPASPPFRGARYRVIPPDELSIRAPHEFDRDARLFLDCNSAWSPKGCQTALLALSRRWPPERLFAVDLPRRPVH